MSPYVGRQNTGNDDGWSLILSLPLNWLSFMPPIFLAGVGETLRGNPIVVLLVAITGFWLFSVRQLLMFMSATVRNWTLE